jgi:hypothetical protein
MERRVGGLSDEAFRRGPFDKRPHFRSKLLKIGHGGFASFSRDVDTTQTESILSL